MESTGDFVGLLDLKKDAVVGLDGQTILLRTDDFLGIVGIPRGPLHLVSVRSQPNATISVGFFVWNDGSAATPLVRRYDPRSEEVSSQPVDDLTSRNLWGRVQQRTGLSPSSLIDYDKLVSSRQADQWSLQTGFVLSSGILSRRGISHADKIIPGSYHDDEESTVNQGSSSNNGTPQSAIDGKGLTYPCIPVVDTALSLRTNRHAGTKGFLSKMSPTDRTTLFMEPQIASRLLGDVLTAYYDNHWEALLGDLQLAYVLFLYLQCLASLEHWKDLVAMLSLVEPSGIQKHAKLYISFLRVLPSQISTMDKGFLEDIDEAGNNFLLPSLQSLCRNLSASGIVPQDDLLQFQRLLFNKFPTMMVVDEGNEGSHHAFGMDKQNNVDIDYDDDDDDDDDSDGPVIVDMTEVEASLARRMEYDSSRPVLPQEVLTSYPLLVAAILPHEDIVMTCARILDQKVDVSLVREAAAYLEDVEQHQK